MANTLTNLLPDIQIALDIVAREKVGFITGVNLDSGAERAAIGQTVRSPRTSQGSAGDNTAGTEVPDTGDETIVGDPVTITKSRHYPVRFNGEETLGLTNAGTYVRIKQQRFAQGFRTLVNEMEADLAGLYTYASRAYGTAGTTPFGTANDMSDWAGAARILDENGCPDSDRQLVLDHASLANLRGKQSGLFHANEAGNDVLLRTGLVRDPIMGFAVRHSGQVASHTKGAATGYDANGGEPVGETTIALDGSDSGTVLAGDVVTFAGDTNKYVVSNDTQTISGAASGNMIINRPGLREALATTVEGTTGANYTANMAFHRDALLLATRAKAMPEGGDKAVDRMFVQDEVSGLIFEILMYPGFGQMTFHVSIAWGYAAIKPEFIAILLG